MTTKNRKDQYDTEALRLAAPGPIGRESDEMPALDEEQRDLDDLCERWVAWTRSRRLYGPPPQMGSILGQLSGTSSRPVQAGGPDAINSAELAAFHLAYTCQPDQLDKRVFALYYVHRVKPIKAAAGALGISTRHFYRLLETFRKTVHISAKALHEQNIQARDALPHGLSTPKV
ncbi:hypothetical protein [Acidovorax sp. ACV01]|uniref:hypothetical protein n=1 Tax=Acidovorax sp. ACV01 TaxID=2769311 RepID=UPI001786A156|nr:hypothetical protein [Acidovorax sp. ACV01]MBD9395599.1 hypothetical protein [Acidovorax sp. ACV01]